MTLASIGKRMQDMRASFWFVPALITVASIGVAALMIVVDATLSLDLVQRWPLLFGAGAAGARGLLTAIATSMITLAGVVFSITIVALSLTSSQYTSRVLRNFMRDRINQVVLGVFVGGFAYCLVVLRTIRASDEGSFVPSMAVLVGLFLAFVAIALLIVFIHHIAVSIQASSIIAAAAGDTFVAVERLYPDEFREPTRADGARDQPAADERWSAVLAPASGYVAMVDDRSLLAWARQHRALVRMARGVGEFVVEGTPLLFAAGVELTRQMQEQLGSSFSISRHRVVDYDVAFGIRQIVDVALKALSPGINDTTTAVMCVDYLTAILFRLVAREIPSLRRLDRDGTLRVLARGPSFETLVAEAFDQIRQNAVTNVAVMKRMMHALESISQRTPHSRRPPLRAQAILIATGARRALGSPQEIAEVEASLATVERALDETSDSRSAEVGDAHTRT